MISKISPWFQLPDKLAPVCLAKAKDNMSKITTLNEYQAVSSNGYVFAFGCSQCQTTNSLNLIFFNLYILVGKLLSLYSHWLVDQRLIRIIHKSANSSILQSFVIRSWYPLNTGGINFWVYWYHHSQKSRQDSRQTWQPM